MALSLAVMVLNVPIYFGFDSVKRVRDDAVVVSVFFEKFVNECNNNSEPATNESNDHAFSHVITPQVLLEVQAGQLHVPK